MSFSQDFKFILTRNKGGILLVTAVLAGIQLSVTANAQALTWNDSNVNQMWNGYLGDFYTLAPSGHHIFSVTAGSSAITGFWEEAEEIEMAEDGYNWAIRTTNGLGSDIASKIDDLCAGFVAHNGSLWSADQYDDDLNWAEIAFARAYQITGNSSWLSAATNNFNYVWVNGQVNGVTNGSWGLTQIRGTQRMYANVNFTFVIAGYLLYNITGDSTYKSRADAIYTWAKANLYVYNHLPARNGSTNVCSMIYNYNNTQFGGSIQNRDVMYNYGIAIQAAYFERDTNVAVTVANWMIYNVDADPAGDGPPYAGTYAGYNVLPDYGAGSNNGANNCGYNGIGLRGFGVALRNGVLTNPDALLFAQANLQSAWNNRGSDNVEWCGWTTSPAGTKYSWGDSSAMAGMFDIPAPNQAINAPVIVWDLPAQVVVTAGKNFSYSVQAIGALPLSYQWYAGSMAVLGQTNSSYGVTAGAIGSTSHYSVVVTNIYGAATSSVSTLTVVGPLVDAYGTNVLICGPVGYWPLQETNETAAPVTMETNYGSLGAIGSAYYALATANQTNVRFGQAGALTASGDNDHAVAFAGPSGLNYAFVPRTVPALTWQPPLTVECWLNSTSTNFSDIISQGGVGEKTISGTTNWGGVRLSYAGNNGGGSQPNFQVYAYSGSGSSYSSLASAPGSLLPLGTWFHCVMTCDTSYNINLYVNGLLSGSGTLTWVPSDSVPLTIGDGRWLGSAGTSRAYNGLLDEVAIYTNVLTANQISNHWLAGTTSGSNYWQTVTNDGPLLFYRMNCAGFTNPNPSLEPLALNYGTTAVCGNYPPGVTPGGGTGPMIPGLGANPVAAPGNGVISCVDAASDPAFNPTGNQPVTAMIWFKGNPADYRMQTLMSHGGNASWSLNLSGTTGKVSWSSGAGSVNSTSVLNDGNWHFAAGVYDGLTNYLYVDGALNNSAAAAGSILGNTDDVYIGGDPDYMAGNNQRYFAGAIAQAAFFTNALGGAQLQQLYTVAQTPVISVSAGAGDALVISYTGKLLSATNVAGPYTAISNAISPYTVPATNPQIFFKSSN